MHLCVDNGFIPTVLSRFVISISIGRNSDDHIESRISLIVVPLQQIRQQQRPAGIPCRSKSCVNGRSVYDVETVRRVTFTCVFAQTSGTDPAVRVHHVGLRLTVLLLDDGQPFSNAMLTGRRSRSSFSEPVLRDCLLTFAKPNKIGNTIKRMTTCVLDRRRPGDVIFKGNKSTVLYELR